MKFTISSAGLMLALSLGACGTPGRPQGLPPPEYEVPKTEPWPLGSVEPTPSAAPSPAPSEAPAAPPEAPAPPDAGGSGATLSPGTP